MAASAVRVTSHGDHTEQIEQLEYKFEKIQENLGNKTEMVQNQISTQDNSDKCIDTWMLKIM